MSFKLPTDSDRAVILGHTGSGKSVAGIWQLSNRSFQRMPWIVFDPKREDLLGDLKKNDTFTEIRVDQKPPRCAGLYIMHYEPATIDEDYLERFLLQVLQKRNIGLYFDEGFTVPQSTSGRKYTALGRIMMQGRSKHIPTITLSQRPSFMTRFVWSEASYFQYFGLTDASDRARVKEFARIPVDAVVPKFFSWWFDVSNNRASLLRPVPPPDTIMQNFRDRIRGVRSRMV